MNVSSSGSAMRSPWLQVGRYALLGKLGRGGFADVYLGEHIYLHTQVAVKIVRSFDEFNVDTFLAEARLVAQLQHPHIIRVLDFDLEGETPFLVMDYAPNGTVRQRYPEGTPLEPRIVLEYVEQVAAALQYIHSQRLIHRDVKPENLLLGPDDEVLLSDFGISIAARRSIVRTQAVVGTVAYMAPEQIRGRPCLASDQYALAVMVYEWLCGVRPFRGSPGRIARQHLYAQPPSLCERVRGLPPTVEQVVFRALAKNPRYRFESVQDFAWALSEAFGERITTVNESFPAQLAHPYPVRADRSNSGPATRSQEKKTGHQRRKVWREVAACYGIDLLAAAILGSILSALNVQSFMLELLLVLCIVLLPLTGAIIRQNNWLAVLTLSIALVAAALALCFHALILFVAVFLALLTVSLWVAFAVSVK